MARNASCRVKGIQGSGFAVLSYNMKPGVECITKSNHYFFKLGTLQDLDVSRIHPFSTWLFLQMITASLTLVRVLAIFQGMLSLNRKGEKSLKSTCTLNQYFFK